MIEGIGMIEIVLIGLAGGAGVGFAFIVYLYRGEKKALERFMRLKRIADFSVVRFFVKTHFRF